MALIVISGKARVGKDTFADILKNTFDENYVTLAYAGELKRKCTEDFDLSYDQLYGDLKEVPDERYVKYSDSTNVVYWTPREIMQFIGTNCYRAIDNNFWVKSLFKYVDKNNLKNVIITDARFPNEIIAPVLRGGYHIRINRDLRTNINGETHASETSLDDFSQINFTINNNGSIEDLYIEAEKIKKEIKQNGL